jgi:S1-C subfamily serine protease
MNKWVKASLNGIIIFGITFTLLNLGSLVYKSAFHPTVRPTTNPEYSSTSVMITKYDGRSGGSGVIVSSKRGESRILTNAHVCSLLSNGGIIRSDTRKGIVKSYQVSDLHDLCLVTTNTNFHINTMLAQNEPEIYDDAIISGHPRLLPNIVTHGHFSQKQIVNILAGFRPCAPEEMEVGNENFEYCRFFGRVPVLRSLEAQVVSATIMPGSSGSAVFNANGELAGLVFAGSGDFGYAIIVPHEYVTYFFETEISSIKPVYPNRNATPARETDPNLSTVCLTPPTKKIERVCHLLNRSLLLTN